MKLLSTIITLLLCYYVHAQGVNISGTLQDDTEAPIIFANLALYDTSGSNLIKVETTDDTGNFTFVGVSKGDYKLVATFVGLDDITQSLIVLNENIQLGTLRFGIGGIQLEEAVVKASRVMVEVKTDRTVFNVDGTVNSAGSDAIELLRKAPGVTVDNNDNINVLGRSGVLLYVDGKRVPITGDELTNYLRNLPAEQIDQIDIISNPGAKYEAEGNAGIIDIRLKKAENIGANGTISGNFSRGRRSRGNLNLNANVRTAKLNLFGNIEYNDNAGFSDLMFNSTQNDISLLETNFFDWAGSGINYRGGVDFFLNDNHTIGILTSGGQFDNENLNTNRIEIGSINTTNIDSILVANNSALSNQNRRTYNLNYRFDNKNGTSLNVDLDYGQYDGDSDRNQPNQYFDSREEVVLTEVINQFETPSEIDITTFKVDYELPAFGGKLEIGSKLSTVVSDNTFLVYNLIHDQRFRNDNNSNTFRYNEMVYAGYANYAMKINDQWNLSLGLRAEQTDAMGDLTAFNPELAEDPVELNYLSWFPSVGLTYQLNPMNSFNFNYGRRINRPDYNVLNPFNFQLSEISFEKGNPFLRPEIVNNVELGYTLNYRYNFKLSYSITTDQITRLIAPDDTDARANFITWDNLAKQTVWGFNLSAPVDVTPFWNAYTNFSMSHIDNQADYGEGAIVDIKAWSYNIYQQHTLTLPKGFKGEVSGWFSGPGVWGGVFRYKTSWSLNLGIQKKFLNDKLNVKLAFNDLFYKSGWNGISEFNGLISEGRGNWDSRGGSLSISYNLGNQKLKSRNRKTGLEDEAGRVSNN